MSSTEPPAGSVPPPGEPTPPPPAPPASTPQASTPPPPSPGTSAAPPPPPPAPDYGTSTPPMGAPAMGAPGATQGVPRPGELMDRFLARLIDFIIVAVVYVILNILVRIVLDNYWVESAIMAVLGAVLYLGYFAYMESNTGQTIGKQVLKLKTFGPDGASKPTMEQAVRRNIFTAFGIAGVVPILGAFIGGVAWLAAVIIIAVNINSDTARRQHWFDKFAGGTQVMKIG